MSDDGKLEEAKEALGDELTSLGKFMQEFEETHGTIGDVSQHTRDSDPLVVAEVKVQQSAPHGLTEPGAYVAVRPIDDEKTYLGIYLGDLLTAPMVNHSFKSSTLFVNCRRNPAMWVPDLKRIVWGAGSWWGEIREEKDLKHISDADIEDVWYVKALKAIGEQEEKVEEAPVDECGATCSTDCRGGATRS